MGILSSKSPRYRIIRVFASLSLFLLLFGGLVGSAHIANAAAFTLGSLAQTETTITLSWATSNDVYFYSYHVWFSTTVNGPYTEIYSTSNKGETQYGVNGLVGNTNYYFYIEDKGLFVDYNSNTVQATTTPNPNLSKTSFDYSSVSLAWVDYNTLPYTTLEPFVSYTLQISNTGSSGPWTTVTSITDSSQNNYRAMGLFATTYYFRLYDTVGPSGNTFSSYSNVISVAIPPPLIVNVNASLLKMDVGQQDQLSSSASGGIPPYNYQWYMNTNTISGATSTSYLFTPTNAGTYSFYAAAQDTLHIWVDSSPISVQVNTAPFINISASTYALYVTQQDPFGSTYGGGMPPYSFQWYSNGNQIAGATSSSYQFTPTTAGTYSIQGAITDSLNVTATSTPIQVIVHAQLALNVSTSTYAFEVGQLAQLSASATGGSPAYGNYQWYLNGNPIAGATSSTYTFTPTAAGTYSIYATVKDNSNATAASNIVSISVTPKPSSSSFPFWPIMIAAVAAIIIVIVAVGASLLRSRNRNKVQKTK